MTRREFIRVVLLGALGTVFPALASCAPVASAGGRTLVQMTSLNRFDPAAIQILKGTVVVWQNTGTTPHTVTDDPSEAQNPADAKLPSGATSWESGDIYPGEDWMRRFDVPGVYVYFCRHDEADGMVGTITVTG